MLYNSKFKIKIIFMEVNEVNQFRNVGIDAIKKSIGASPKFINLFNPPKL